MKEFEQLIKQSKRLQVVPINSSTGNLGDIYEVGNHTVRVFNKQGRKIITCDCQNDSKFCNEPTICIHKIRLINYLSYNSFEEKLKNLIDQYRLFKLNKLESNNDMICSDLQKLKDLINR